MYIAKLAVTMHYKQKPIHFGIDGRYSDDNKNLTVIKEQHKDQAGLSKKRIHREKGLLKRMKKKVAGWSENRFFVPTLFTLIGLPFGLLTMPGAHQALNRDDAQRAEKRQMKQMDNAIGQDWKHMAKWGQDHSDGAFESQARQEIHQHLLTNLDNLVEQLSQNPDPQIQNIVI